MPVLTAEACRVFESVPDLYLILSPDFHILTASDAYLAATYTQRHEITGRIVFEVFPDNPDLPDVHSVRNLRHSLEKVARTKEPHQMELQRYDVQNPSDGGGFEEKYWNPINCPVLNEGGEMLYIIHKVTDVSEKFRQQQQIRELKNREQSALKQVDWEQRKLRSIL